jgi:putative transposase
MTCPHCQSAHTPERAERTELGYRRFRCRDCHRECNERTGTLFNRLQYPSDVVCLVVVWRLRYKLSLRDLAEIYHWFTEGFDTRDLQEAKALLEELS